MELYQSTNQIKRIRLIEGPEKPRLTKAFLKYCEQGVFTVGKESNRQALTLESGSDSPAPLSEVGADIVSSYTTFGTIQVPAHGRLTVLMADRQSTGGFARIGQVAAADLPVLGQMRQGQRLCFSWISIEEARSLQTYFESMIDHALLSSPLN
jgi:allophanate hydrolase subunit 2